MRVRLEPIEVYIDIEGTDLIDCVTKARKALEGAGFKPSADVSESGWIIRDERAIHGEDSGSPIHIPYEI